MNLMPEKLYHDGKSLIEKHVEGHPLSRAASNAAIVDLAKKLAQMHALPATCYGALDFDLQGMYPDAATYFSKIPPIIVDRSDSDLSESQERILSSALELATALHTDLISSGVVLGHGDLWRSNILVSPDEARVIDWDRIGAYPPESDLIFMADADLTMEQQTLFLHHYGRPVNNSLLSWFNLRRTLMNEGLRLEKKVERIQQLELV
jgi:aminoglycoside phosphotransferase (APT) family kinase protein